MANEFLLIVINALKIVLALGLIYFWYSWAIVYGAPWWRSTMTYKPQKFPMEQLLKGVLVTMIVALFVLPGCRTSVTRPTYRPIEHVRAPASRWELPPEERSAYDRIQQMEADAAASAELLKKNLEAMQTK